MIRCPFCGHRHEVDPGDVLETRTVGVTDDWQTWETIACQGCGQEFMYRTE